MEDQENRTDYSIEEENSTIVITKFIYDTEGYVTSSSKNEVITVRVVF